MNTIELMNQQYEHYYHQLQQQLKNLKEIHIKRLKIKRQLKCAINDNDKYHLKYLKNALCAEYFDLLQNNNKLRHSLNISKFLRLPPIIIEDLLKLNIVDIIPFDHGFRDGVNQIVLTIDEFEIKAQFSDLNIYFYYDSTEPILDKDALPYLLQNLTIKCADPSLYDHHLQQASTLLQTTSIWTEDYNKLRELGIQLIDICW